MKKQITLLLCICIVFLGPFFMLSAPSGTPVVLARLEAIASRLEAIANVDIEIWKGVRIDISHVAKSSGHNFHISEFLKPTGKSFDLAPRTFQGPSSRTFCASGPSPWKDSS